MSPRRTAGTPRSERPLGAHDECVDVVVLTLGQISNQVAFLIYVLYSVRSGYCKRAGCLSKAVCVMSRSHPKDDLEIEDGGERNGLLPKLASYQGKRGERFRCKPAS